MQKSVTFCIYSNQNEELMDAYKYVKEYINLLNKLPNHEYNDNDYIFPNMSPKRFAIDQQGSTRYIRLVLKEALKPCGLDESRYANHSLRNGGARHKLIYSMWPLNLDQIRFLAGWIEQDTVGTVGILISHRKVHFKEP